MCFQWEIAHCFCFASKLKKNQCCFKKKFSSFYFSGKYSAFSHVLDHSVFVGWGRGWWLSAKGYDRRSLKGVGVGRTPLVCSVLEDRQESYEDISPQNDEKRQWTKIYIFCRRRSRELCTTTVQFFDAFSTTTSSLRRSPRHFFPCKYLLSLKISDGSGSTRNLGFEAWKSCWEMSLRQV